MEMLGIVGGFQALKTFANKFAQKIWPKNIVQQILEKHLAVPGGGGGGQAGKGRWRLSGGCW